MSINALENCRALQRYLLEHPYLQINGDRVECTMCKISMKYFINQGSCNLSKHISSKKHMKNNPTIKSELKTNKIVTLNSDKAIIVKNGIESVCDPIKRCGITDDEFDSQLVQALIRTDIPLSRLENTAFSEFLERHTNRVIKPESYYRKKILTRLVQNELTLDL